LDPVINIKLKLGVLWVVLMFFYLYNDVIGFFRRDTIEGVLSGSVGGVAVTPGFLLGAAVLMAFPILMVLLSVLLPAKINRPANLVAGVFHLVLLGVTTTVGEAPWAYYALYMAFEGAIIVMIIYWAWKWPRQKGVPEASPRTDGLELGT
jgi:hypothetical protein